MASAVGVAGVRATLDLGSKSSKCVQCGEPDSARITGQSGSYTFGSILKNAEGSGIPVASWIVKVLNSLPARRFGQLSTSQSTLSMPIGLGWLSQGLRGEIG